MVQTGKSGSNMAYFLPSIPLNDRNDRNAFHRVLPTSVRSVISVMPKRGQNQTDFSNVSGVSPRKKKGQEIHPEEETGGSTSAVEENLVSGVLQGDICSLYVLQLQVAQNAVVVLNTAATKFFLKDFNLKTRSLWDKHYVSLERKAAAFAVNSDEQGQQTELKWLYHCSCSKSHGDLVLASAPHINMLYKDWLEMNPGCIHVQALGKQMQFFDDIYSISPSLEQEEEVSDSPDGDLETNFSETFIEVQHPNIIAVNPPSSSWGILSNNREGKKCLTCRPAISSCVHWDFVVDSINTEACPDFVIDFFEFCRTVNGQHMSPRGPKCLSYQKIPVTKFGSVKNTSDIPDVLSAIDETGLCPFCEEQTPLSVSLTSCEVTVFTQYKRKVVQAYSARSPQADTCDHIIPFDGLDKGILNMTTFMVGHDVLRDYLSNFLYGRMPLYTFFRCWQQRQMDGGFSAEGMLSYFKFRMAWYSFLSLVEEDFKDYFICPICKDHPSLVIFDATSLAFRRSFVPRNPGENTAEQPRQRDAGRFKERVMINHKHTRDLLQSYCNSQRPLGSIDTLLSSLDKHSKAIKAVVEWCISQEGAHNKNIAPMYLRPLLTSLAKPSPACALVPATNDAKLLLEKIKTTDVKKDPLLLQSLQRTCPLLFDVVKGVNLKDRSLPEVFDALLTELWSKSIAPFEGNTCMQQSEQTAQETDSFVDSIAFWPHLPSIRGRGSYSHDRRREKHACRKLGKSHKSLLPGTVTMHCEHGICYGFQVMLQVESPNTIFTILRTRFSIAPDVVIYDFGCGLHNYCLNREAKFFQNTKFLIDRYHQPNHKGCSLGYKMSLYHEFEKINSQLAEQKNSKLSRIKPQLAYMTPVNFMKHAQLFLGFCNKEVRVSLNSNM